MAEYYEGDNSCVRCLRSSPTASLLGFILVLIGGGAFGGATIFARRYIIALLRAPHLFPYMDYAVYGLNGAVALFTLLAYILCTLSSGRNAKQIFESSRKSACGRCCNMTLIILLVVAVIVWTASACLMTYPVMSIAFLLHRNEGPTRIRLASLTWDKLGRNTRSALVDDPESFYSQGAGYPRPQSVPSPYPPNPNQLADYRNPVYGWPQQHQSEFSSGEASATEVIDSHDFTDDSPPEEEFEKIPIDSEDRLPDRVKSVLVDHSLKDPNSTMSTTTIATPGFLDTTISQVPTSIDFKKKVLSAGESAKLFFQCKQDTFDLSYYGLYDENGLPLHVPRANFEENVRDILICVVIALAGIFLLILGYVQMAICTAMNYARMQESRYYEASEGGEEGMALQQ
ncbi:unnamed protein product [Calicophoron daubneyi]|uniref:Uncharacterized protein n=1 Tax=Calicophoron daubneyi TaxID=300641 RepID=A0AAV2TAC9_CALDB